MKNPEEFVKTAGKELVLNGRAKILQLETDNRNKFVSYKVVRAGYWYKWLIFFDYHFDFI